MVKPLVLGKVTLSAFHSLVEVAKKMIGIGMTCQETPLAK
jgi:hypothetical protein